MAWWNSLNPLERELLTFLLLFYYGSISVIIVIFTLHLVLPFFDLTWRGARGSS